MACRDHHDCYDDDSEHNNEQLHEQPRDPRTVTIRDKAGEAKSVYRIGDQLIEQVEHIQRQTSRSRTLAANPTAITTRNAACEWAARPTASATGIHANISPSLSPARAFTYAA